MPSKTLEEKPWNHEFACSFSSNVFYWTHKGKPLNGTYRNEESVFIFKDGHYSCDDGPAVISSGLIQYYIHGKMMSREEWFEHLTPDQKKKVLFNGEL